jgi:transcriptional regulator with XRE-family HTH domain
MSSGLAERLKELRQRFGLTQQALARSARLSVSTVARLEQGGRATRTTVNALAQALQVPAGTLAPDEKHAVGGGGPLADPL